MREMGRAAGARSRIDKLTVFGNWICSEYDIIGGMILPVFA